MTTHCSPEVLFAALPPRRAVDDVCVTDCGEFIEVRYADAPPGSIKWARFGRSMWETLQTHPRMRCAKCGLPFDFEESYLRGSGTIVVKGPASAGKTESLAAGPWWHMECE